jgi:hypothetical protein
VTLPLAADSAEPKTNQFMLLVAQVAVCSQINTKLINAVWAERTVLNIKPVGASRGR